MVTVMRVAIARSFVRLVYISVVLAAGDRTMHAATASVDKNAVIKGLSSRCVEVVNLTRTVGLAMRLGQTI